MIEIILDAMASSEEAESAGRDYFAKMKETKGTDPVMHLLIIQDSEGFKPVIIGSYFDHLMFSPHINGPKISKSMILQNLPAPSWVVRTEPSIEEIMNAPFPVPENSIWAERPDMVDMKALEGEVIDNVIREDEAVIFETASGTFTLKHEQDCCEEVYLESIDGDISHAIGYQVLEASEESHESETDWGTQTWSFYRIRTERDTFVIRFFGESNGYYSETASLYFLAKK